MSFLHIVIGGTLALAAVSLVLMSGLILYMGIKHWQQKRDDARSAMLINLGLEYLEHPELAKEFKSQLKLGDRRLLLKIFQDLLFKVRGEYAERVVVLLAELGLIDECLRRLQSRSWWRRMEACKTLGVFRDERVIAALEKAMDDRQVEVRVEAARSLAKMGKISSVTQMVKKLSTAKSTVGLAIIDILRSLGTEIVPELIEILRSNQMEDAMKFLAVDALGYIGDLRAVPALLEMCLHTSEIMRMKCLQALGKLGDPLCYPAVYAGLRDPAWEVRANAAKCAGQMEDPRFLPVLTERLNDQYWWVRYYAAEALLKMGDRGISVLRLAAQCKTSRAQEIAFGLMREKLIPL